MAKVSVMTGKTNLFILIAVMVSSFLTPFTGSALTLSLPDMGQEFGIGPSKLSWVIEVYLLASLVVLLPMGRAADHFGKRKLFLCGNGLFTVAAVAAPFLPGFAGLLLARAVQGLGSAMVFATGMAILSMAYQGERRGWALGWNVSTVYVGLSLGPVLGGFLNHYAGWHSIFYVISLFGLLSLVLGWRYIPESYGSQQREGADWLGIALYGVSMLLLMIGLAEITASAWGAPLMAVGLAGVLLLLRYEAGQPEARAVIPVQLLRTNRLFAMSSLTAMLNYGATFAISFLLSLYLQYVLGMSSDEAGLVLLLQPLLMAVLSPWTGRMSDKYSPAYLCAAGMGMITMGMALLAAVLHIKSIYLVLPLTALIGTGFSFFSAPNNNAVMSSVEKGQYSLAASMLSTVRMLGQNISMALAALLIASPMPETATAEALLPDLEIAFAVFAAICAAGICTSLVRNKKA